MLLVHKFMEWDKRKMTKRLCGADTSARGLERFLPPER
jgi:hypothetical protein